VAAISNADSSSENQYHVRTMLKSTCTPPPWCENPDGQILADYAWTFFGGVPQITRIMPCDELAAVQEDRPYDYRRM